MESTPSLPKDISADPLCRDQIIKNKSGQSNNRALWIVNYENDRSRTYKLSVQTGSSSLIDAILIKDTNLSLGCRYIKELELSLSEKTYFLNEGTFVIIRTNRII